MALLLKEPITRSEYERRLATAREAKLPMPIVARALARHRQSSAEKPLSADVPLDMLAEAKRDIENAVEQGLLAGEWNDGTLFIQFGPFCEWMGVPVRARPECEREYDVFPDDMADVVRMLGWALENYRQAFRRTPTLPKTPPTPPLYLQSDEGSSEWNGVRDFVMEDMARGMADCWTTIGAIEVLMEEVAAKLGGESARRRLDEMKERLQAVQIWYSSQVRQFDFPEADNETVEEARTVLNYAESLSR
jgi:hypothetical protein